MNLFGDLHAQLSFGMESHFAVGGDADALAKSFLQLFDPLLFIGEQVVLVVVCGILVGDELLPVAQLGQVSAQLVHVFVLELQLVFQAGELLDVAAIGLGDLRIDLLTQQFQSLCLLFQPLDGL